MVKTMRSNRPLLEAVFWDYPQFRDEVFLRHYLTENRGNSGYEWVMARFLERGRVVDTFKFFTIEEIVSGMDNLKLSPRARAKWKRMVEVYG